MAGRTPRFPYLVDVSTGKLVRDHAEDPDRRGARDRRAERLLRVGCTPTNAPRAVYDVAAVNPALEGTFDVDGAIVHHRVHRSSSRSQNEYTPRVGVRKRTRRPRRAPSRQLARAYAEDALPASRSGWGGNDKMANADIAGHAAAALAALTGNVCKLGANVGVFVGGSVQRLYGRRSPAWELPEGMTSADD